MICDPKHLAEAGSSPIVSYISDEIKEICGDDLLSNPEHVANIARAVEAFIEREGGGKVVSSKYLVMLAARALSSVGEGQAARKLLILGTGLVRPSQWEVVNGKSMWVLDLKQMTVREDVCLEMVFVGSLGVVLEAIADIWDETKGHGVLGLRNICCVAERLVPPRRRRKEAAGFGKEVLRMCEDKLNRIAGTRNWETIPLVMNLSI